MKHQKVLAAVSVIMLGFALSSPVWADTRTATMRVSCTILPMIELSSPELPTLGLTGQVSDVRVNTNMGKKFGMDVRSQKTTDGSLLKIYSVTAL